MFFCCCSLDLTQTPSIPCTVKILPLAPWPGAVLLRNAWYQLPDGYVIYTAYIAKTGHPLNMKL